jgi:hypothetical protein
MSRHSLTKRGLTLGWSIGLGVVLLVLTGAVLLPSTKSARINFDQRRRTEGETTFSSSKTRVLDLQVLREDGAEAAFSHSKDESYAAKDSAQSTESSP